MALFDRLLHEAAEANFFANSSRCRRDHHCNPPQRLRGNERKIVTVPERRGGIRHKAEQQNNGGMNYRGKEERCDKAPQPLLGCQLILAERLGTGGSRCTWRTSSARPPKEKREEYRLNDPSELHTQAEKQQQPDVGSSGSNKKACENGPQRNGQLCPKVAPWRCHCRCLGTAARRILHLLPYYFSS